ncbi:MAG: bifunctional diguanylate cyclase/phosphodiesterase [Pseudomonadota bacterium]
MNDSITEINDRLSFIRLLNSAVLKANENKTKLALLVISINRLQRINEIHDYKTGDASLKYMADKLKEAKRPQDTVGRLSGSKFGLILFPILNKGHAQLAAHKILRLMEIPLEFDDQRIKLDISIGMSLCPSHSSLATGLLKKAEAAIRLAHMQEAKICITEDYDGDEITEFWDIELGIEQAIINSEFELYYQPKISLKTGLPSGAEALIRWPHPSRGMIYPDQFIPIAEDHGHIKPMTIWILNVALRESTQWTTQWGPINLSVNIPPDLMNEELVDLVDNALNIWHPENVTLVLEILERSFALTNEDTFSTFTALQNLGTDISIDDFGTGYSALSYFKSIPAKELKIDKSFIQNLLEEKGNFDIVTFIIKLAHAFNMRIVAEGVEDTKTLTILKTFGCDYIQGYVVAKPMPHDEFLQWLENYKIEEQSYAHLYIENATERKKAAYAPKKKAEETIKIVSDFTGSKNDEKIIVDEPEDLSEIFENTDLAQQIISSEQANNIETPVITEIKLEPEPEPKLELIDIHSLTIPIETLDNIETTQQAPADIEIIDLLSDEDIQTNSKEETPTTKVEQKKITNDIDFGDIII